MQEEGRALEGDGTFQMQRGDSISNHREMGDPEGGVTCPGLNVGVFSSPHLAWDTAQGDRRELGGSHFPPLHNEGYNSDQGAGEER